MKKLIILAALLLTLGTGQAWAVRLDFAGLQPDRDLGNMFIYITPDGELTFWNLTGPDWEIRADGLYTRPRAGNHYSSTFGFMYSSDDRPINALNGYMTANMRLEFEVPGVGYVSWNANDKLDSGTGRADLSLFTLPEGKVSRMYVFFNNHINPGGREFLLTSIDFGPPSVVPVPGALWLLGSGLAGLAVLRRKKA